MIKVPAFAVKLVLYTLFYLWFNKIIKGKRRFYYALRKNPKGAAAAPETNWFHSAGAKDITGREADLLAKWQSCQMVQKRWSYQNLYPQKASCLCRAACKKEISYTRTWRSVTRTASSWLLSKSSLQTYRKNWTFTNRNPRISGIAGFLFSDIIAADSWMAEHALWEKSEISGTPDS